MILFFTSDKCTWCDVLKKMLDEEWSQLGAPYEVHEVNVDKYATIAEVYSVLVVPTLVAGPHKLTGVPTSDDLRSFVMQALSNADSAEPSAVSRLLFTEVRALHEADTSEPPPPELTS
jgi:thioredoxin-like negative regulator of GroEL